MGNISRAKEELAAQEALRTAEANIRSELAELTLRMDELLDAPRERQELRARLSRRWWTLSRQLTCLESRLHRCDRALVLLDEETRRLLTLSYCRRSVPEDLMEQFNMEKSTLYRKRRKALAQFAQALYGGLWEEDAARAGAAEAEDGSAQP